MAVLIRHLNDVNAAINTTNAKTQQQQPKSNHLLSENEDLWCMVGSFIYLHNIDCTKVTEDNQVMTTFVTEHSGGKPADGRQTICYNIPTKIKQLKNFRTCDNWKTITCVYYVTLPQAG